MRNPFEYGTVVGKESFCNRKKELADLIRIMENSGRAFIYSERRLGKTSLVMLAKNKLPRKQFITVYVDLWPTDGEGSFVATLAKAITHSLSTSVEKALELAKELFSHFTPSITVDQEGNPVITFGSPRTARIEPQLEEVLSAPAKLGRKGKKLVIVLDEFQQILTYGTDRVEQRLRSVIQHQKNVAYIFLGSRKHIVQEMFLEATRPLYRSATHYPLGVIDVKDWLPFIRERFLDAKKKITDDQIRSIVEFTQGHPFYTQHLCHVLWELCESDEGVADELLARAIDILLARENHAYTLLWESLTKNQQRFLRAFALEEKPPRPFASDFLQRYRLSSPSSAQRVVQSLLDRDVIDREDASFLISDRFFRLWVRRLHMS